MEPELGRFLSPDPFVQFPASTQGFNCYAYVGNNPLSYADPSGYFLKKALRIELTIAAAYYTGGTAANLWGDAAGAMIGGAVGGYLNTGDARGAMLGALSAGVAYGVGHKIGAFEGADFSTPGKLFGKSLTHGVTHGAIARAGGGRFGDGALGAFAGSLGGPALDGVDEPDMCELGGRAMVERDDLRAALVKDLSASGVPVKLSAHGQLCYPLQYGELVLSRIAALDLILSPANRMSIPDPELARLAKQRIAQAGIHFEIIEESGVSVLVFDNDSEALTAMRLVSDLTSSYYESKSKQ